MQIDVESLVRAAIAVLCVALIVGIAAERLRIPYIVALLIVSLPLTPIGSDEFFVHSFLLLLLPALIFEAAWNFHTSRLRDAWPATLFLAVPAVLITILVVACGLSLTGLLPFLPAMLLGAIVAPTDPIAVLAAFKQLHVPKRLAVTVEGEALFNDGIGVVIYGALVAALTGGTPLQPLTISWSVVAVSLGGALIGALVAGALYVIARFAKASNLHVIATIVAAYGAYVAAEHVHLSGIFAALLAGMTYRILESRYGNDDAVAQVNSFWGIASFFANTVVFLIVGVRIEIGRIVAHPWLVLSTIALVVVARLLCVYAILPFLGIGSRAWQHVIALSGIRGGVSIALAIALPHGTPYRELIVDAAYGVVAATILVQGTALEPILRRLRLEPA